ncbi:hypothetical protein KKA94_00780, partial [Patescibacteria group bacterium]|nr:hypothetical protein [Patescibacteria group bacterium]
ASLCGENAKCKIENSLTSKIDSLGLRVFRNRRVIEKYAGKEWSEIKSMIEMSFRTEGEAKEVFGVSGTLPMFRSSVIEEVGLFDLSYGSYKEDVDLAFRLRSAGHKAFVLLNAVSHHDRTGIDIGPVKNKKNQPEYIKYNSYKNHLMTLYKNEYWQNLLLDLPWILWYELRKFSYFLLFDRKVLVGLRDIWRIRKELKIKRLKIKKLRKISWREMRKWWL